MMKPAHTRKLVGTKTVMAYHQKYKKTDGVKKVLVRCLGPGPEHLFFSVDSARNRICTACSEATDRAGSPRLSRNPVKVMR